MNSVTLRSRGNALLMTLIALAVLMMIVAAAIQFTGTNREAAVSKARADELQSCATTARKLLLAKLRMTSGGRAGGLTLNSVIPDSTGPATDKQVRTAHYDKLTLEPVIVKLDSNVMGASRYQVRDMANTAGPGTLGGDYYRVVVTCRHPGSNAQSEVEFTFRHGI